MNWTPQEEWFEAKFDSQFDAAYWAENGQLRASLSAWEWRWGGWDQTREWDLGLFDTVPEIEAAIQQKVAQIRQAEQEWEEQSTRREPALSNWIQGEPS